MDGCIDGRTLWQAGWTATVEHPASCYAQPVVVAPDGDPVGDADVVRIREDGTLHPCAVSYTHLTLPTIYSV